MIQIPPQAKIFAIPVAMHLDTSIDAYINTCKSYEQDPFSGELFAFRDKNGVQIGILSYDGHGFHWCIKRFSEGKIAWWPSEEKIVQVSARDFQIVLWGGNPQKVELPDMWKPLYVPS